MRQKIRSTGRKNMPPMCPPATISRCARTSCATRRRAVAESREVSLRSFPKCSLLLTSTWRFTPRTLVISRIAELRGTVKRRHLGGWGGLSAPRSGATRSGEPSGSTSKTLSGHGGKAAELGESYRRSGLGDMAIYEDLVCGCRLRSSSRGAAADRAAKESDKAAVKVRRAGVCAAGAGSKACRRSTPPRSA